MYSSSTAVQDYHSTECPVKPLSIGEYLIERLQDYGIADLFGIPGDYVLSFYSLLEKSDINVIGCTREDNAGFAADAYARVNGMGAVCVTYCVGGLSVCNSIAGAFAEKSPVVLLTGSPGYEERRNNPLLHHKVRDFRTQVDVFDKLCVTGTELNDPATAFQEIDRVLEMAYRYKRPVYIDIPRDMVNLAPQTTQRHTFPPVTTDERALQESCNEITALLNRARNPAIVAGVEIHRFGLQDDLIHFAEKNNIPIASTLLGKSVVRENHPLYVGLYEGAIGREEVTEYIESSDCILMLGAFMTDLNLGIYTANLDARKCVYATSETLKIHHHHYENVPLDELIQELILRNIKSSSRFIDPTVREPISQYVIDYPAQISIRRMIDRLNQSLDKNTIVIADIGDSLFASTRLQTQGRTEFLSPAYYTSMGFSIPATLGAQTAMPDHRVITICGDGAFQMTCLELSTIVRQGFNPIVIVLDNGGYGTERALHPGEWNYNEIQRWSYGELTRLVGGGIAHRIQTEEGFDKALKAALADDTNMHLMHVELDRRDASETLIRLADKMSSRV
ncbi:MAG: preprotein translocase subunit Tim44 [Planctomycetaceae bacterium]|nr:preprotein translocase subunit Tim44 [Planctomycetaceae bacterium]